ncbi:MAG: glycosyltransferase [Actinomycetota bacterium]
MGLKIASVPVPETTKQRLSLCMIMKDEEEHLTRCLESVQGVVDEIVIVDTGSTDRSVEIAERFGARVLHEEWRGDFAAPRNTAIDAATGDWILVLDADEELVDGRRLLPLLQNPDLEGYSLREVNFIGEDVGIEAVVNAAFRVFRNRPEYRYEGALHEQIMGKIDPEGGVTTRFVGIEIRHYGYLEATSAARRKTDRNMAIVLDEVRRKPDDSFTLFNAGVEYQRIDDHETALEYFQRSFATLPSLRAYYASLLIRNIVASLRCLKRYDEALDVLKDALQAYPDFTDLHYLQGQIHMERREYRAAIRSYRRAIELGDHGGDRYLAQSGMGSFYSWYALGTLHEQMGDVHEAVRAYRRSISTAPGYYAAPLVRLTRALLTSDDPEEVERYLSTIIWDRRRGDSFRTLAAVFLEAGAHEIALRLARRARDAATDGDHRVEIVAADCLLRLGRVHEALAELDRVPASSAQAGHAAGKRFLAHLASGDLDAAARAIAAVADIADGLYATSWALALAAQAPGATPPLPAGAERDKVVEVLLDVASGLLAIDALEPFNRVVPLLFAVADRTADLDERLGLLLHHQGFREPAAARLMAAVDAGTTSPEVFAALGEICTAQGLDEEAATFLGAALEHDDQNLSRYLALAGCFAGQGRYDDAGETLRRGLLVFPHSTVLRELRHSLSLLGGAAAG